MNSLSKERRLALMTGFERYTKKPRRAIFVEEMEQVGWRFIFCSSGSIWRTRAGTGVGGARVSGDEAEIWLRKSALPRAEEERASLVCHLRAGQPGREPEETAVECGVVPSAPAS